MLLAFLFLAWLGSPPSAHSDLGDELKKWVGFGKWLGPDKKTETKPETNPSATKSLSYTSSGNIEDVRKKPGSSLKEPFVKSPSQNVYHCQSGCEGACHFAERMGVARNGSVLELTFTNGNAKGLVDEKGNISMKSETLSCSGKIAEDHIRLDCSGQNMSCQEVIYKI